MTKKNQPEIPFDPTAYYGFTKPEPKQPEETILERWSEWPYDKNAPPPVIERSRTAEEAIWRNCVEPIIKKYKLRDSSGKIFEYQFIEKPIDGRHIDAIVNQSVRFFMQIHFPKTTVPNDVTSDPYYFGKDDFYSEILFPLCDNSLELGNKEYDKKDGGKIKIKDAFREFLETVFVNDTLPELLEMIRHDKPACTKSFEDDPKYKVKNIALGIWAEYPTLRKKYVMEHPEIKKIRESYPGKNTVPGWVGRAPDTILKGRISDKEEANQKEMCREAGIPWPENGQ